MRTFAFLAVLLITPFYASADDDVITLGVIGDSVSDEYKSTQGGPFLGYEGHEWGTILVKLRNVSFGQFSDMLTPFNQTVGFDYNYALKGQAVAPDGFVAFAGTPQEQLIYNTFDIFFIFGFPGIGDSGQRLGDQAANLAQNFALGEIDAAVIQGGANDFFIFNFTGGSYTDPVAVALLKERIISGFEQILDTPIPMGGTLADEKVLLSLVPFGGGPDQQAVTAEVNQELTAMAKARGVPTFDMFATLVARADFSRPGAPITIRNFEIPIGSVANSADLVPPGDPAGIDDEQCGFSNGNGTADFGAPGCPTKAYQLNITQDDGVHATTITAAFTANDVVNALREHYGIKIKRLKDKEIGLALGNDKEKGNKGDD